MKSIQEIFSYWDTITDMSEAVGESHWAVSKWKQRGRIPQTAWKSVVNAARNRGKNICTDDLLVAHSKSKATASRAFR